MCIQGTLQTLRQACYLEGKADDQLKDGRRVWLLPFLIRTCCVQCRSQAKQDLLQQWTYNYKRLCFQC